MTTLVRDRPGFNRYRTLPRLTDITQAIRNREEWRTDKRTMYANWLTRAEATALAKDAPLTFYGSERAARASLAAFRQDLEWVEKTQQIYVITSFGYPLAWALEGDTIVSCPDSDLANKTTREHRELILRANSYY